MTILYYIIPAAILSAVLLNLLFLSVWRKKKVTRLVSIAKADRWSGERGIPLTGGIVLAANLLFFTLYVSVSGRFALSGELIVSLSCALAMFFLGLFDDLFEFKSYQKFLGQIIIIVLSIYFGVRATLTGSILDLVISLFWMLALTNAFNLIDNMDGLAGGIACIAAGFLAYFFYRDNNLLLFLYCLVFGITLLVFLAFNFKPAKIYLGDNGSLLIGFFLSFLTIMSSNSRASGKSIIGIIIFPVFIMLIPIFDTALVSITRKRRGQSPFQGGRDHLSHRLVTLGMSERQAVIFLYSVSFILGMLFLIMREVKFVPAVIIYFLIALVVLLFGIYIGKIRLETKSSSKHKAKGQNNGGYIVLGKNLLYKSQLIKIVIDLVLIVVCYYLAYLLRFGAKIQPPDMAVFRQSVEFILLAKLIALGIFRVYRVGSRYYGFPEVLNVVKALTIVSFATLVLFTVWRSRFGGFSRAVIIIDWMLSLIAIGGVKVFYRFFDELFYPFRAKNNTSVVFLGEQENYKLLDRIVRLKSVDDYRIVAHIPTREEFERRLDRIVETAQVVVMDKQFGDAFTQDLQKQVKDKDIHVFLLFDFIKLIFKNEENR
jgi:UDP-GlcNAc:undecaprenyl-phosphate GlcNAc-1-phosphate transferase